jgi:hypothetical protein
MQDRPLSGTALLLGSGWASMQLCRAALQVGCRRRRSCSQARRTCMKKAGPPMTERPHTAETKPRCLICSRSSKRACSDWAVKPPPSASRALLRRQGSGRRALQSVALGALLAAAMRDPCSLQAGAQEGWEGPLENNEAGIMQQWW